MIADMNCVVTLPNHKGRMSVDGIYNYQVVGTVDGQAMVYNIITGQVSVANRAWDAFVANYKHDGCTYRICSAPAFISSDLAESMGTIDGVSDLVLKKYLDDDGIAHLVPKAGQRFTSLVTTLVESKVEGDEVLKGLKALGVDTLNFKLKRNYLGGWMISTGDIWTDKESKAALITFLERVQMYEMTLTGEEGHEA